MPGARHPSLCESYIGHCSRPASFVHSPPLVLACHSPASKLHVRTVFRLTWQARDFSSGFVTQDDAEEAKAGGRGGESRGRESVCATVHVAHRNPSFCLGRWLMVKNWPSSNERLGDGQLTSIPSNAPLTQSPIRTMMLHDIAALGLECRSRLILPFLPFIWRILALTTNPGFVVVSLFTAIFATTSRSCPRWCCERQTTTSHAKFPNSHQLT